MFGTFALMSTRQNIPLTRQVNRQLREIPEGEVFDYSWFRLSNMDDRALALILSRKTQTGELQRLSKGKYFKPKLSEFGQLRPSENEVIKSLTVNGKAVKGYITGIYLYNQLGLTTQVASTLTIAVNDVLRPKKIRGYKIKYSKQRAPITKVNIPLLQLLDACQDIKTIPDTTIDKSFRTIKEKVIQLSEKEQKRILKLLPYYNAATRALVGALFEKYISPELAAPVKESLNTLTKFSLAISTKLLPNKTAWNIQ